MKKKRMPEGKNILYIGTIIILIGVLILIIALWQTNELELKKSTGENVGSWMIFLSFIADIGKTIITIGAGTALYSYFDFINYIKKILIDVVIQNNYLDELSDEKKRDIISKLEKQVIYDYETTDDNTLYDFVNKEIQGLVKSIYYESMYLNINCRVVDNKMIEKDFIREYECNFETNRDYEIDLAFMTKCSFVDDQQIKEPFAVKEFSINGKNLTDKIERKVSHKDGAENSIDTYTHTFYYDFKNAEDKKAIQYIEKSDAHIIKIVIKYKTIVPVEDNNLAYRVYVPCKKFEATLVYDDNDMSVFADIFAFKDRKVNERKLDTNRVSYCQNRNCINIVFKDWILPGDGIMYLFNLKN